MKKTELLNYNTPQMEIVETSAEQGFAVSNINYPNMGDEEYL